MVIVAKEFRYVRARTILQPRERQVPAAWAWGPADAPALSHAGPRCGA
jgi:hypothetical protein